MVSRFCALKESAQGIWIVHCRPVLILCEVKQALHCCLTIPLLYLCRDACRKYYGLLLIDCEVDERSILAYRRQQYEQKT
ncbi:hypothetical protein DBR42_16315 [Pelomonas sp. HMWF004]|nr:hypothetical protein DBR42_16315 [Pelomonas sp. HMWF004]